MVGIVSRLQAISGDSYQNRPEEDILLLFQSNKAGSGAHLAPYSLDNIGAKRPRQEAKNTLPSVVEFKNG